MKKYICFALVLALTACALTFGACGKKHVIDTDITVDGNEVVSGGAGVIYQFVTDKNGEAVTDAEGETVTVAVTVPAEASTTAADKAGAATAADATTKKGETTTKAEVTTRKGETTTRAEITTKKQETTTKKSETTTKKPETTTKKPEPTTAKPTTTAAPEITVKDGEYVMTLSPDKTTVKAGETFNVTLKLSNCKNVKSFGMEIRSEGSLAASNSRKNMSADGINMEINTAAEEGTLIGGYFKDSYSFDSYDLCTITYKVSDSAVKGETLVLTVVPTQMDVGTGNGNGVDYSDAMKISYLYVTVGE